MKKRFYCTDTQIQNFQPEKNDLKNFVQCRLHVSLIIRGRIHRKFCSYISNEPNKLEFFPLVSLSNLVQYNTNLLGPVVKFKNILLALLAALAK